MVQTEQQYKFVYMAIKFFVESQEALKQASNTVATVSMGMYSLGWWVGVVMEEVWEIVASINATRINNYSYNYSFV